jgi:effector-binding domain-containing protein
LKECVRNEKYGGAIMYDVKIREFNSVFAMTIRFISDIQDMSSDMRKNLGDVWDYMSFNNRDWAGECFSIYHDEVFNPNHIDVECGFSIKELLPDSGNIKGRKIEGRSMISTIHTGPYEGLEKAHNAIMEWMELNGYAPVPPMMEMYHNDPSLVPEEEIKTELLWPYRKK